MPALGAAASGAGTVGHCGTEALRVEYLPRVIDSELDSLLGFLPAIALEGAKAVGKTATATRRARSVHALDDADEALAARADPSLVVTGEPPILIDEWQRMPVAWDLVRRAVDEDRSPGRFLLTGSANRSDVPVHSGAGRIVRLRVRPLTLGERRVGIPTVSLAALLSGERPAISGSTGVRLDDYVREIVVSGLPGLRGYADRALRAALDGYIAQIVEREFPEMGHRVRNPAALRRWMTAYASMISTTASFESIREAATGGRGEKPSRNAVAPYVDILEALWVLEPVPAWLPTNNRVSRLGAAPKHQLFDPAIAARLMNLDPGGLMRSGAYLGALFESLVTLCVRVYAQAAEATVLHLRTREPNEHEVDLIVERGDGRVVAIEVKLARTIEPRDVRHLRWLRDRIGDELLDAVIVTTGTHAYREADGIAVVPAALLGP